MAAIWRIATKEYLTRLKTAIPGTRAEELSIGTLSLDKFARTAISMKFLFNTNVEENYVQNLLEFHLLKGCLWRTTQSTCAVVVLALVSIRWGIGCTPVKRGPRRWSAPQALGTIRNQQWLRYSRSCPRFPSWTYGKGELEQLSIFVCAWSSIVWRPQ